MPEDIVAEAVGRYAHGWFPMDVDPDAHAELPWWSVEERWLFELDPASLGRTRRAVRRSLAHADAGWELRVSAAFEEVVGWCAREEEGSGEVWLTPRMRELYAALHRAGVCQTLELWVDGRPAAGLVAVLLGRAAMLESMAHRVPHAGNVALVRWLEELAARGFAFADVQTPTDHTVRLGARPVPRAVYEERLARALAG